MENLTQKYLFKKIVYELRDNCLHLKSKGLFNSIEYDISFEEISDKIVYETRMEDFPKFTIVCSLIFLVISIANKDLEMFFLAIAVCGLFLLFLFLTRNIVVSIMLFDSRVLKINQKKPDIDTVNRFVSDLQFSIKEYLKLKYGTIDRDLPVEPQLNNYTWLKNRNIIDDGEFNNLKDKLLKKSRDKKIGFN